MGQVSKAEWTISNEDGKYNTGCTRLVELILSHELLTKQRGLLPKMYNEIIQTKESNIKDTLLTQVEELLYRLTGASIFATINEDEIDLRSQNPNFVIMNVYQRIQDADELDYPTKNLGTIPLERRK